MSERTNSNDPSPTGVDEGGVEPQVTHTQRSAEYEGNQMYLGMGIMRWCALCGTHRAVSGGTLRHVLGARHWVCHRHMQTPVV